MKELLDLFFTFARIGGLTFGGGYAMLPIIQKELVEGKKWATENEVMDYYAVGQCTPGIIAVNTATFIGYNLKGIPGAIFATLGVVFPSLIIIVIIASLLNNIMELAIIQSAFTGIRLAVIALIIDTVIKLWKSSISNLTGIFIALLAFIISVIFNISPVYIIISAAFIGYISSIRGGSKKWFI